MNYNASLRQVSTCKLTGVAAFFRIIVALTAITVISCNYQTTSSDIESVEHGGCHTYKQKVDLLEIRLKSLTGEGFSGMALTWDGQVDFSGFESIDKTNVNQKDSSQGFERVIPDERINLESTNDGAASQELASLNREIAAAQKEFDDCVAEKFGQITKQKQGPGNAGHCNYNGQKYDIYHYNCHSAANASVRLDPNKTGIVSCHGDEPLRGSPAHHTFNYRIQGEVVVYYNWGQTCRAPKNEVPPNLKDPDHHHCAMIFCGDQYQTDKLQAFKPGALVEEPGPLYCSQETLTRSECDGCCRYRGTFWDRTTDDLRPNDLSFTEFMSQCYSACSRKQ